MKLEQGSLNIQAYNSSHWNVAHWSKSVCSRKKIN